MLWDHEDPSHLSKGDGVKLKYILISLLALLGCKKDMKSLSSSEDTGKEGLLNYARTTLCPKALILEPMSIEQLQKDVKSALQKGHKLMTGTKAFRSEIDASCAAEGEVQILTTHLDKIEVDIKNKRVVAEAGATLKEVLKAIEKSAKHKFTIRSVSEGPFFTMGGMLGSGTHGSGTTFDATFADNVTRVWLIDGQGQQQVIDESRALMAAVRTNLGVLGIITKVEVKLAPAVRLKAVVETGNFAEDSKEAVAYIKQKIDNNDSVSIAWFPGIELRESKTKYVNSYSLVTYKETSKVPASDYGNFQGYYGREFMEASVSMFKLANKPSPTFSLCDMANVRIGTRYDASYFKPMDLPDKKIGVGKMKEPVGWAKDIEYFDCPEGCAHGITFR